MRSKKNALQWVAAILHNILVTVLFLCLALCALWRGTAELQFTEHPTLWGYGLEAAPDGALVLVQNRPQYAIREELLYLKEGTVCRGWVMLRTEHSVSVCDSHFTMVQEADIPLAQVLGRCVVSLHPFALPLGNWLQLGVTNQGLLALVAAGVIFAELPRFLRPKAFCELEYPDEEEEE